MIKYLITKIKAQLVALADRVVKLKNQSLRSHTFTSKIIIFEMIKSCLGFVIAIDELVMQTEAN